LDHPPTASDVWKILPPTTSTVATPWVHGCDGKWLGRVGVFFIHRNVTTKENLWWSFMTSESYEAIGRDCKALADRLDGHLPTGAVSDWKGAIVSAVASYFGPIPHQRCLAHVVRQAKRLLPLNSPFEATKKLRWIAENVTVLETSRDPAVWNTLLTRWHKEYGAMLKEKTIAPAGTTRHWWYTHGNMRRAWRLLTYDQDPLFMFLINPLIPNTNNALEGVNSNLKQKLGDHRGMKTPRQTAFLSWYMVVTRIRTHKDIRRLWGWWKSEFSQN
jgi:transposase-like protein